MMLNKASNSYKDESAVQTHVRRFLTDVIGAKVVVNTPATYEGVTYTAEGIPDITGILPDGTGIAVEVKHRKGGRVSKAQKNHLSIYRGLGAEAWVVYDSNIQEFIDYMLAKYDPVQTMGRRTAALLKGVGLSGAKNGDIPAHKVHDFLRTWN